MNTIMEIIVIVGIIMYIVGAILFLTKKVKAEVCAFLILAGLALYVGVGRYIEPTEEDVLAGKAIYQETITITQTGDSIKTYQIVWKDEQD